MLDKVHKKRVLLSNRLKTARPKGSGAETTAMIFGKKPVPRGAGEREGERGKVQRPARAGRGVRFEKGFRKRKADPPARAGEMISLAGFGRLE